MLSKFLTKRKIALIILFFFSILTLLAKPIQAFYTPNASYQFQFEQAVYGMPEEMNLQSFVYETLKATVGSLMITITGCLTCSPEERETGMIQTISSFIAFLYTNPPASGVEYLADLGRRIGIIQPAYAQETGFGKMEPYREIWKTFRNLTYVFFVLILVFMGFAIMFRVKINPQTVITIQSALPKVVIALILITFSYAIVGLLIDFMFVAANLALFTIGELTHITDLAELINYDLMITSDVKAFGILLLAGLFPSLAIILFFTIIPMALGGLLAPVTLGNSLLAGTGISFLVVILLAIIFLIALIRVFWSLLKAYVMVVINLIFAPFQILIGVLPGSNAIGSWFRNLIANLAVFPAILTMVLLSFYLVYKALETIFDPVLQFITGNIGFTDFMSQIPDTFGNLGEMTILSFVSLGILLMTPKVSDMIKAFFAGKPFEYGTAIGEAMGPARIGAAFGLGAGAARIAREWEPVTRDRFMTVVGELQKRLAQGSR